MYKMLQLQGIIIIIIIIIIIMVTHTHSLINSTTRLQSRTKRTHVTKINYH